MCEFELYNITVLQCVLTYMNEMNTFQSFRKGTISDMCLTKDGSHVLFMFVFTPLDSHCIVLLLMTATLTQVTTNAQL